jgi:hypothetical protein
MLRMCLRDRRKTLIDAISIGALLVGAVGWKLKYGAAEHQPMRPDRPHG